MPTTKPDPFHWARRVSRRKVQRLYESDAAGRLDLELLDDVGYGIYARVLDMFQVRRAIHGEVTCRSCGVTLERHGPRQVDGIRQDPKAEGLACPSCDWQVTWGDYYDSYAGKCMLIGSAPEAFEAFVAAWPQARTPAAKMRAIDALIHDFHVNQGIDGRPVGENVITGTKAQVIALIRALAYGDAGLADPALDAAWRARLTNPVRCFRQSHSWAETRAIAKELGIPAPADTDDQDAVVREILRRRPKTRSSTDS